MMKKIALLGAGKIGAAITTLLSQSGRYQVRICDADEGRAKELACGSSVLEAQRLDLSDTTSIDQCLKDCSAVLSALPFFCNVAVAERAAALSVPYFDLTEDVSTTRAIKAIAASSNTTFMPQCGIAPGFVSIAGAYLINSFETVDRAKLRVGALPIFPSNRLKYNLTWSTDGLINEYINPSEVVVGGKKTAAFALEGYEIFSLNGVEYEAFNTSGGLGTLCETYEGKVSNLDYKSIRYPGHRDYLQFLLEDLGFAADRAGLKAVFERSIPGTAQDKCIIFVAVTGYAEGKFQQRTYASTVYNQTIGGVHLSAIQLTTAAGVLAPMDLVLTNAIPQKRGFVRCEDIPLRDFLTNQFGRHYRDDIALSGL
jgi:saccharopine dehydrogenase-like NADP-dependent oxidoreductase